jgi:hypothetical protein
MVRKRLSTPIRQDIPICTDRLGTDRLGTDGPTLSFVAWSCAPDALRQKPPRFIANLFEEETMANHSKVHADAEAQFRKTLKATWKGKKATTPYEAEARVARNKTARLKELRMAKEAGEKAAKIKQGTEN